MIPSALYDLPQWIVWRLVMRDGKPTKIPFDPRTGHCARTSEPSTWASLSIAERAMVRGRYDGLGFVFAAGGSLFGLDLDGCLSADGEVAGWADQIIERFDTYCEVSPSGTGVKLYAAGVFHDTGRRKQMDTTKRQSVEVYGWGRYFCFTGRRFPGSPAEVRGCQVPLWRLLFDLWPAPKPVTMPVRPWKPTPGRMSLTTRAARAIARIPPSRCGQGQCHNRAYRGARLLCQDFGLSAAEAYPIFVEWIARSTHRWTEAELLKKLHDAETKASDRPRGWFATAST